MTPSHPHIHFYSKWLVEWSYRGLFEILVDFFFKVLYKIIFEEEITCMSREAMSLVLEGSYWFASPDGTYLRVFSYCKPSHMLSRYAMDKVVM